MVLTVSRRFVFVGLAAFLMFGIAGCGGPKVSGKYVSDGGAMTIDFESGKATLSDALGNNETDDYTVDGSSVTVKSKDRGDLQFTIAQDGSLTGQGVTLKKSAS
jgi:hypothetical protein